MCVAMMMCDDVVLWLYSLDGTMLGLSLQAYSLGGTTPLIRHATRQKSTDRMRPFKSRYGHTVKHISLTDNTIIKITS